MPRPAFPQAGTSIGAQNVTAGTPEPKVPPSCSAGADPALRALPLGAVLSAAAPSPAEQSSCSVNRYAGTAPRAQGLFPKAPPKRAVLPFIPSLLSMGHPTVNRALSARTSGSCPVNAGWACLWGSHLTPAVLGVPGGAARGWSCLLHPSGHRHKPCSFGAGALTNQIKLFTFT